VLPVPSRVYPRPSTTPRRRRNSPGRCETRQAAVASGPPSPRTAALGGSNRMLSARDVAAILAVPERTVRDKWREWGLQAYRIGKHLRWKERDVHAWIDRQTA
jgi:excisionase family DNA binding protein